MVNKIQLTAAFLLLLSSPALSEAKNKDLFSSATTNGAIIANKLYQPAAVTLIQKPKFIYAEMLYQVSYGEAKLSVHGKTVSELLKKSVAQSKYRDDGLELMGEDGWELASTLLRDVNSGFEIFYYFKKQIN